MKTGFQYSKFWFWGIILGGGLLPPLTMVVATVLFDPRGLSETLRLLPSYFISPIGFLFLIWNDVPFIVFAIQAKQRFSKLSIRDFKTDFQCRAEVIGAGIAIFSTSILIRLETGRAIIRRLPGSSTAGVIDGILPIYLFIAMGIGYWVGGLIGRLILRKRSQKIKGE